MGTGLTYCGFGTSTKDVADIATEQAYLARSDFPVATPEVTAPSCCGDIACTGTTGQDRPEEA